jgi:hypothetical protein
VSATDAPIQIMSEIAELMVSNPSEEQLLNFRPSEAAQRRARELLLKQNAETLSRDEDFELTQFEQAETLMQLVKARLWAKRAGRQ